ncbi:hypothetical protein GCM10027570_41680 [Streptomonospora sediminis]
MSAKTTHRIRPPTHSDTRFHHLTRLAAAVRSFGGTAVLALGRTSHPVLYVGHRGRTIAVVLVQDAHGGWGFVWGRRGWADSAQVEAVAAHLAGVVAGASTSAGVPVSAPLPVPPPTGAHQRNPIAHRRHRRPFLRKAA